MLKHLNTENSGEVIYLATPYTHGSPTIQIQRYKTACQIAGSLINQGYMVFSPVAHSHLICEHANVSGSWEQWEEFCTVMVGRCDRLWIATIPGWKQSKGIAHESAIASQLEKPIALLDPETLQMSPYILESKELQNV